MLVLAWTFAFLSSVIAVYWAFVLGRLAAVMPSMPRVGSGLSAAAPPNGWPKVSVIVPAHNEERVIEACASSILANEYPSFELIIVLDRCTDRTRALLEPFAQRDERLRLIDNGSCPDDWAGKCNAARIGAAAATGAYLLFTDADVQFDPALLRASVGLALRDTRGLLSLLPSLVAESWHERVVQPVAALTLMRMYPINKVNRGERRRPFANGQFLLFERGVYERIGGHAATKDDLLEDLAFARLVDTSGGRVGLAVAGDMLVVHMYSSFAAMRNGWKRIFIEACRRKASRLRAYSLRVCVLGVLSPVAQLITLVLAFGVGGFAGFAGVAAVFAGIFIQIVALTIIYEATGAPVIGALLFPVGSAIVAKAMWDGATDLIARRPVRWGGREYVIVPRD